MPDSIRWYLLLLLITAAYAPLARLLAGRLAGKGAFIAKPLGLLALVWPVWFLASISPIPFDTPLLWLSLVAGAAAGWGWLARKREIDRSWVTHLLVAEAIFLVAYIGYIGLRGFTPEISGTEKPMDIAFFSASARATDMPPPDPWMSGEPINYYYLGYLLHDTISRLSDVPTWVGFNLALATTFAMTVSAAAGLAYGLVRDRFGLRFGIAAGALASFFIAFAGNMHAPLEFLRDPGGTWNAFWWQGIGWKASRIVFDAGAQQEETINEFPSFSFILGDLHPHVMALPFTLVSLTIALNLFDRTPRPEKSIWLETYGPLALAGAVIGALYPLNSWDYPTYLIAAALAIALSFGWSRETLARVAVLGVASVVAWAPFWLKFVPFAGGANSEASDIPVIGRISSTVAAYSGDRTSAGEFLTVFGLPWLIAIVILTIEVVRGLSKGERRVPREFVFAGVALFILALALPAPVIVLAGAPFAAAVWLLTRAGHDDADRTIIAALFAAGFGLILLTEFFYIQDGFNGRFNTLFKVYYQVWTLFGIAAALACVRLWRYAGERQIARLLLGAGAIAALALGLTYPIISARTWTEWQGPREWAGLDGSAYLADIAPDDLAAIHWLATNAQNGDVVLEAPGCSYQVNGGEPTSRVSAFTGVPTVIGWTGHEGQWRAGQDELYREIEPRTQEVDAMFSNPDDAGPFDFRDVTLLFVGTFEREGTGSCEAAGPFPAVFADGYPGDGWTEIFASGETRIYRRDNV